VNDGIDEAFYYGQSQSVVAGDPDGPANPGATGVPPPVQSLLII